MSVTIDHIRRLLSADEPDYAAAARLGPQILPQLATLIRSGSPTYASRAAYLASLIPDPRAIQILQDAAKNPSPIVRVAIAAGMGNVQRPPASVLAKLLDDKDQSVRKMAIK